jgi:CDP-diacylglycerol---glycerol-3-phosphate 3-phosphatidyltransferase
MANLLTATRLLLALPFALLMASGSAPAVAGLVLVAAIATDLLDGAVARRRGTVTAGGGAFDHAADFIFVVGGLAGGASRGVFPWILPVLVAAAFAQYVVDSYWIHGHRALRPSWLGRYNGILYFVPLGGDVLARVGPGGLRPLVTAIAWLLVASTALSMAQRLRASWRGREQLPRRPPEEDQTDPRVEEDEKVVLDESERRHLGGPLGKEHDPQHDRH